MAHPIRPVSPGLGSAYQAPPILKIKSHLVTGCFRQQSPYSSSTLLGQKPRLKKDVIQRRVLSPAVRWTLSLSIHTFTLPSDETGETDSRHACWSGEDKSVSNLGMHAREASEWLPSLRHSHKGGLQMNAAGCGVARIAVRFFGPPPSESSTPFDYRAVCLVSDEQA